MGLNLEQKQAVVAEIAKQVAGAQAIVMVENRGMAVADMTKLRAKARASGVFFRVVKNTLVRRAVAQTPFASLSDKMIGPLAYGIGRDPVAVARDFAALRTVSRVQGLPASAASTATARFGITAMPP